MLPGLNTSYNPPSGSDVTSYGAVSSTAAALPSVPYTKGAIVDGVYINEWANIQFEVTDEYPETPSVYSTFETNVSDCGFVSQSESLTFCVTFDNLTMYSKPEPDWYVEQIISQMEQSMLDNDFSFEFGEASEMTVADASYAVVDGTVGDDFIYVTVALRIVDNRGVSILLMSPSQEQNYNILSAIDSVN